MQPRASRQDRNSPGQKAGQHPPGHAADRGSRDIEPHGEAEAGRVDLLGEIGDGDRRHAANGKPFQGADDQDGVPAGSERDGDVQQAGQTDRGEHQFAPAEALGNCRRRENGDGEKAGGQREHQRALRRAPT